MENWTTIGGRIAWLCEHTGISRAEFARRTEISAPGLSHILNGRNNPDFNFVARLFTAFPNVNKEWLVLGSGEPFGFQENNTFDTVVNESAVVYEKKSATSTKIFSQLAFTAGSELDRYLSALEERIASLESRVQSA